MTETPKITAADAGCWLDGHFGWHNTYRVVELAVEYGFVLNEPDAKIVARFKAGEHYTDEEGFSIGDAIREISDEATEFLGELAPEGYHFDWDMGEFGLYADEDEES